MAAKRPKMSIYDAEVVRKIGRKEFDRAIKAFAAQLDAPLTDGATEGHFVGFFTTPRSPLFARYRMQGGPCCVRFEHGRDDFLEAWVESRTAEDQIVVLRWERRTWTVIGKGVSTTEYDGPAETGA